MGFSGSLSPPSEPPDIGNWFSSYVYESPELNTIAGFESSTDSIVAETEELPNERKQNMGGNIMLARSDDLPLVGKGITDVKSSTRDDNYMSNGLKYSDSSSLGSEPLDVMKWFSSYVYESPVLDTSYEFRSNHKEIDAKCGSREQEVTLSNPMRTDKYHFEVESIPSDGHAECSNSTEDAENENSYTFEDSLKDNGNQNSGKLNDLSSDQAFLKKIEQDRGNGSGKDLVIAESSLGKLSREFNINPEVSHGLLNITSDTQKERGKSAQESNPRLDLRENSSKAEGSWKGIDTSVSAENIEINRAHANPVKKTCGKVDNGNKTEFAENGFISTRKGRSRQLHKENSSPFHIKSDHVKNEIIISEHSSDEVITRRKVLSETTNFQTSNRIEVTGKWKCPQKRKPDIGPPLKQLRLEQWVRRV